MMNLIAKSLVLVHTLFSVAAMTWAMSIVLQAKDYGWVEPYREVLETNADGSPKAGATVRYASEYDKSWANAKEAANTRDRTYVFVKPALESLTQTAPNLPTNRLFYRAELKRLQESLEKIEVKRLKDAGLSKETPPLGPPVLDDKVLDKIVKSNKVYQAELKEIFKKIDVVEEEIRKKVKETKSFTADLTGTDEANNPVPPSGFGGGYGLYQLIDREFKAQTQIKNEIDEIKPFWSKAIEQARLFQYRRIELDASLEKLKAATPAAKNPKKL